MEASELVTSPCLDDVEREAEEMARTDPRPVAVIHSAPSGLYATVRNPRLWRRPIENTSVVVVWNDPDYQGDRPSYIGRGWLDQERGPE